MVGVTKRFAGTVAVDGVDFELLPGEVHALMGENGAGKSTLMKILAGSFADYTGQILIDGQPVDLRSPQAAQANGVAMIYQELSLAPPISVAENLLAGRLPGRGPWLDRRALTEQARACLARVGLEIDPAVPVEDLSLHEAQLVEVAKALATEPRILVMDEPTSALSREEVDRLFELIDRLRGEGLSIIYISHHLPEVFRIVDRVTVMRDGRRVITHAIGEVTSRSLVELMVGGSVNTLYPVRERPASAVGSQPLLRVEGLTRYGFFHDVSFALRPGEIVGLCGLAGSGRSEVARSLCGLDPLDEGRVFLAEEPLMAGDYGAAIGAGLAYLTEDRKAQGLALRLTIGENLLAASTPRLTRWGRYREALGRPTTAGLLTALQVHPAEPEREVSTLSGGNQQKVLLGKWLATEPRVLILDEPTRGVDVGAKAVIHRAVAHVADQGHAVLLISSDLPELVGLSDRILVLREGHLIGELRGEERSEETALLAANGELPGRRP
ncbi:MAG: sugar ABC transporter ATP-binding protein [Armatimonadetes bacterium]|nr:sugar ABC transporter ATP-binding protein [Armatimonadota bacterium]